MFRSITNTWFPTRFQGQGKRKSYFEGYYIKIVDAEQQIALAFIPGISLEASGNGHAFIQVVDGARNQAFYHKFPLDAFSSNCTSNGSKKGFSIQIGKNTFSESGCEVDLPGLHVSVGFRQNTPWPWSVFSPGAMGPFSFVPFMQCKHGVISLHHRIEGQIIQANRQLSLKPTAIGYIEKDWGKSFPRGWIWLQSNHIEGETDPCCIMVSAGRVPWITGAFRGFITAFYFRGDLLTFTTYNRATFQLEVEVDTVFMRFKKDQYVLEITAHQAAGVELISPSPQEGMHGKVNESLRASARLKLYRKKALLLEATANWVGFEIGGDAVNW